MSNGEVLPQDSPGRQRIILAILASVQFTSIVDFMVVMPLGPQLERTLGLNPTQFGMIVSAYAFAAGLAGLAASSVLDRFARKPAFLVLYTGFLAGTLACGFAATYTGLLIARFFTGAFGGVLGGMSMAIIGDVFPEERRGSATGALMSAFALASVFGVPLGLELGLRYDWHAPFLVLALLGLPFLFLAASILPRLDAHLARATQGNALTRFRETYTHPNHIRAFGLTITMMFGSFSVVPYISPYLVSKVGLADKDLRFVYATGGLLTLVGAPLIGRLSDRFGKLRIYRTVAPLAAVMTIVISNLPPVPLATVLVCFGGMMLCNAGRMIPAMAMITSSVEAHRRGGFQGANSAIQHMASGVGAAVSGLILKNLSPGTLDAYPVVGLMGAGMTIASLWFAGRLRVADAVADHQPISTVEALGAVETAVDAEDPVTRIEAP